MFMRMIHDEKLAQHMAFRVTDRRSDAMGLVESHQVKVLDVRRQTEFARGHLPGAVNIAHTRLAGRMDEVPRDQRLLVNCQSGGRSAQAAAYLKRAGYDIVNLKGGMLAWKNWAVITEN